MTLPANAIEMREPVRNRDVLAGTFSYTDTLGTTVSRPFYVRTCAPDDSDGGHCNGVRQSDLNQQLGDAFQMLQDEGFKNIHYADIRPNPFF